MESHVDSPSSGSTTSAMPETPSRISPERKWTEEKSESTTLVTNDQLLIDVAEEIGIVVDLVAARETTVADLEVVRGIVADAADLTREIDEKDAARREAALDRDREEKMSDETVDEAALEADLDLAREIDAPNLEMRMKRNARDLARPKRRLPDRALDPDPAPDKHFTVLELLSFSASKF